MAIIDLRTKKTSEQDKLLSPTEAKSFGVPYGTTREDAFGMTPAKAAGTGGVDDATATQKARLDTLNTVIKSLDDYKTLYSTTVGKSGSNIFGSDAGALSGAYNALLFQVAQAAGTGALQAADRQVVEAMIPNPTTPKGIFGRLRTGGRTGSIKAIEQAKSIFQNNKVAIETGKVPPAAPQSPQSTGAPSPTPQQTANRTRLSQMTGQVAQFALEATFRFAASAAASPVDVVRTAMGKQPIQGNIPLINKPTFQAQGTRDIGQLFDKAYAGENVSPWETAKGMKTFAEVPLAAAETVGLGKTIGSAKRLFAGQKAAREVKSVIEMISPELDKKTRVAAFAKAGAPGGVVKGRLGAAIRTPDTEDIEMAKTAAPFVKGKDPIKTVTAIRKEIADFSERSLRPYLQANPRAYNSQTLQKYLTEVEPPDWIKADDAAERTYTLVKQRMLQAAQQHPGTMEGLWDARQTFDDIVEKQFGPAKQDAIKRTFTEQAISDTRHAVHEFITNQTGDSRFKESMKYLSRLYRVVDRIAQKNYTLLEQTKPTSNAQRIKRFGKYAGGAILGAVGTSAYYGARD